MTKVEEVARAIWQARRDFVRKDQNWDLEEWGDGTIPKLNGVMDEAEAAIKAMQSPTEAMVNAALHDHATNAPYETPFGPDGSFARQFNAQVDAALAEDK